MSRESRAVVRISNAVAIRSDSEISESENALIFESGNWFSVPCRQIVGKDPGPPLRIVTGFPESTCYRYAAKGIPAGGDFVRALLRSEQGRTWLAVVMDGCEAAWWIEQQALQAQADKVVRIRALIGE